MSETVTFEQGLSAPMWAKESTMRELVDALKDQKSTSNKKKKTENASVICGLSRRCVSRRSLGSSELHK